MPELDVQVRELVDASASPITVEEAKGRAYVASVRHVHPRSHERVRVAAAAAGVAVLVAAGVVALLVATQAESPTTSKITTPASSRGLGVTPDCVEVPGGSSGCARTLPEAQAILGIRLVTPRVIPDGWKLEEGNIVVYPPHFNGEPNETEVRVYRQIWTLPGTDLTNDPTPSYLTIKQRGALPGEVEDRCVTVITTRLMDGTLACGDISRGNYGTNGPLVDGGGVWWTAHGVTYSVQDRGLTNEEVLRVLDSLG
jgi:hypothetical protein